jgi:hypothetical protein
MLCHLVASSYAQVDTALANEGGDICGGEEDEGHREVLDEGDVKSRVAVELDIRAVEEVEA